MYLGNVMDLGNFKATTTPLATFQDQAKVPFHPQVNTIMMKCLDENTPLVMKTFL